MAHTPRAVRLLALALCCLLALTGCGSFGASVEDLLTAPALDDQQAAILDTVRSYADTGITLVYPKGGAYRNPITLQDIDGDDEPEAITFYTKKDEVKIHINVAKKMEDYQNGERWQVIYDIEGLGNQVNFIDFAHVGLLFYQNIIVGYSAFSEGGNTLVVYGFQSGELCETMIQNYTEVAYGDLDGDMFDELVLFNTPGDGAAGITADLYERVGTPEAPYLGKTAQATLDPSLVRLRRLSVDSEGQYRLVYADGLSGDNQMTTEALCYDGEKLYTLSQYERQRGSETDYLTALTRQNTELYSQDVDGDGHIEVPRLQKQQSDSLYQQGGYFVDWYSGSSGGYTYKRTTYEDDSFHLRVTLLSGWVGSVTFQSENDGSARTCLDAGGATVFSVLRISRSEDAVAYTSSGFKELGTYGSFTYLYKAGDSTLVHAASETEMAAAIEIKQ